jgi:hypothetical protein
MPSKKRAPSKGVRPKRRSRAKKIPAKKRAKPRTKRAAKKPVPRRRRKVAAKKRSVKRAVKRSKKRAVKRAVKRSVKRVVIKRPKKRVAPRVAPRIVPRPPRVATFYREPVGARKLVGLPPREARHVIAQERLLKVAKLQEDLTTLRKVFGGFEAKDGYPLAKAKLTRLSDAKIERIRKYAQQLKRATSVPNVQFVPKNNAERRAAIQRAGLLGLKQKVFFIHHSDARIAKARYVKDETGGNRWGTIEIVTKAAGGEVRERIYYFPHRPRAWDDVIEYTEELLEAGMATGFYKLFNSIYGPIGDLVEREKLIEALETFFSTYNTWLAGTILGWVWLGTSYDSAAGKQQQQRTTAQRFQEARAKIAARERKRLRKRLGLDVRVRKKIKRASKRPK